MALDKLWNSHQQVENIWHRKGRRSRSDGKMRLGPVREAAMRPTAREKELQECLAGTAPPPCDNLLSASCCVFGLWGGMARWKKHPNPTRLKKKKNMQKCVMGRSDQG